MIMLECILSSQLLDNSEKEAVKIESLIEANHDIAIDQLVKILEYSDDQITEVFSLPSSFSPFIFWLLLKWGPVIIIVLILILIYPWLNMLPHWKSKYCEEEKS
jgi:hypothetical protein